MPSEITDAVMSRLQNFTVGLVYRKGDAQGRDILGSGVLVSIDGRRGLLTCGHVAELYEERKDVAFTFIVADKEHKFRLSYDLNIILASSKSFKESEKVLDLAFTLFTPELAASVEATRGVFLNLEKNAEKMAAFASTKGQFVDAIFGVVGEFTGEPTIEGNAVISNFRGSFYSGSIRSTENGLLQFEPTDSSDLLPKSFGGMSGGGVWRIYYAQSGNETNLETLMLCGVASWEIPDDKKIACQGWSRIEQTLIPQVRKELPI